MSTLFKWLGAIAAIIVLVLLFTCSGKNKEKIAELQGQKQMLKKQRAEDSIILVQKTADYLLLVKDYIVVEKKRQAVVAEKIAIVTKYQKEKARTFLLNDSTQAVLFSSFVNKCIPIPVSSIIPDTSFVVPALAIRNANQIFLANEEKGIVIGSMEEEINYLDTEKTNLSNRVQSKDEQLEMVKGMLVIGDNTNLITSEQLKQQKRITRKQKAKTWLFGAGWPAIIVAVFLLLK